MSQEEVDKIANKITEICKAFKKGKIKRYEYIYNVKILATEGIKESMNTIDKAKFGAVLESVSLIDKIHSAPAQAFGQLSKLKEFLKG